MEAKELKCRVCNRVCVKIIRIHSVYNFGIDCCSEECANEAEANIERERQMEHDLYRGWLEQYGGQDG